MVVCEKSFGHFFFYQPTGKTPALAKATPRLSKVWMLSLNDFEHSEYDNSYSVI